MEEDSRFRREGGRWLYVGPACPAGRGPIPGPRRKGWGTVREPFCPRRAVGTAAPRTQRLPQGPALSDPFTTRAPARLASRA